MTDTVYVKMYLMDMISHSADEFAPMSNYWKDPELRIFSDLKQRMKLAPRYILDHHVMSRTIELGLGRPSVFREAMRHVRVPYTSLWIEWEETARDLLRRRLTHEINDYKPLPVRLGFLMECEPGGRRGTTTWVWESPDREIKPHVPNVSPYDVAWDLDATIPQSSWHKDGMNIANLAQLWMDNPVQHAALMSIWETAEHRPSAWGRTWLNGLTVNQQRFLLSDIYGEYMGMWAVLLLLTAAKPTVEYSPVDRSKINKARTKRKQTPLLDYHTVTMHVDHQTVVGQPRGPLGYARRSPRTHLVSSYLARRNDKHWIVSPYVRGSGGPVERHVRVTR